MEEQDYIPLSYINTFVYCPRRFYYEFVQKEMLVNEHVEEGKIKHSRTEEQMQGRSEKGKIVSRKQYLASERLRISGYADVVEEKGEEIYPIEYKKGRMGNWLNDKIQLCLQGMLMEEWKNKSIHYGYLYYIKSNRRKKVPFDEGLRKASLEAVAKAWEVASSGLIPDPVEDNRCNGCSLRPVCLPEEVSFLKGSEEQPRKIQPSLGIDNVLYVDEQGAVIKKQGERVLVFKNVKVSSGDKENYSVDAGMEKVREIPIIKLGQLVICGNVNLTTPLMRFLLRGNIPVAFLSEYGRYEGMLTPAVSKNSILRIAQHQAINESQKVLELSKGFVMAKLSNMRTLLMRRARVKEEKVLEEGVKRLKLSMDQVEKARRLEELLGIEGSGTSAYFTAFGKMLNPGLGFDFEKRSRRPPADPINSLLSFAYTLLSSDMISNIHIVGMDPYIGFYHQPKYGRPCLALDLMEEFRPIVADSVVISLVNNESIKQEDFIEAGGGWFLKEKAREKFYAGYERRKDEHITHPVFKYTLSYRRAFELQARILAKYLVGEIEAYYPLIVR